MNVSMHEIIVCGPLGIQVHEQSVEDFRGRETIEK